MDGQVVLRVARFQEGALSQYIPLLPNYWLSMEDEKKSQQRRKCDHHPCKRGEKKTCEQNHHGTQSINSEPGTPTTRCVAWKNCPTLGERKLENKGPISFRWVIDNALTSNIKLYHMVMLLSCPECTIWTSKCPIFPDIHFQHLILKDTPLKFDISPLKIGQTCSKRSHSYHSSSDHH